jgi:hypothetical protein
MQNNTIRSAMNLHATWEYDKRACTWSRDSAISKPGTWTTQGKYGPCRKCRNNDTSKHRASLGVRKQDNNVSASSTPSEGARESRQNMRSEFTRAWDDSLPDRPPSQEICCRALRRYLCRPGYTCRLVICRPEGFDQ